jgi:hypothetical protein
MTRYLVVALPDDANIIKVRAEIEGTLDWVAHDMSDLRDFVAVKSKDEMPYLCEVSSEGHWGPLATRSLDFDAYDAFGDCPQCGEDKLGADPDRAGWNRCGECGFGWSEDGKMVDFSRVKP